MAALIPRLSNCFHSQCKASILERILETNLVNEDRIHIFLGYYASSSVSYI